ncbi:MAG TPA: DUF885 domain-containing protein [Burkholderiaceae bacterium]|nr:DUF885 domain-containing protein [Burkholderiaceae bacterium]
MRIFASLLLASCLGAITLGAAGQTAPNPPADPEAARLHALFDAEWEWAMRTFPEWATFSGDHRYDDRLSDESRAARDAVDAHQRETLVRLEGIDRGKLGATDRVSYDLMLAKTKERIEGQQFRGERALVVTAQRGPHLGFANLMRGSPAATEADLKNVLARMALFPRQVDQTIEQLREGIALGWVTFKPSLERVPAQIDGVLAEDVTKSPLFDPFTRMSDAIAAPVRERLAQEGQRALRDEVYPALRKLRDFVVRDLLPLAPQDGAMSAYPGGRAAYEYALRTHTTTPLSAEQIHAIGQREVKRLRGEMESQMKLAGFEGSFDAFVAHLNTDPRFFHKDAQSLLAGYRDIGKRIDPELPKLFAELPRAPYGVRAIPAHEGAGVSDRYQDPAADGTTAGWFEANVVALGKRPTWQMETLMAHESVPGHHLQIARALELKDLPRFRRDAWYTAYIEGWALYAETLGTQLGLYADPYSRFGHLQMQAFRAARLVVDTGIHALGWSRQQAIDWMTERTGLAREEVEAQVDRYYVWPGQATSYMIGELKLIELRDRARAALGDRFDIRRFHMAVLDTGPVPLSVLERQIDDWIAAEKVRPR